MRFLAFIVDLAFDVYIFVLLLRLFFQKLQAGWHNPIVQLSVKMTDPIIKPMRRFLPGVKGFDLAIVVTLVIFELAQLYSVMWLRYDIIPFFSGAILTTCVILINKTIYIFLFAIIIWSLLSWFVTSQRQPFVEVTGIIAYPLMRFARRFIPPISGLDLSPIVVLLLLYLVQQFVVTPLLAATTRAAFGY